MPFAIKRESVSTQINLESHSTQINFEPNSTQINFEPNSTQINFEPHSAQINFEPNSAQINFEPNSAQIAKQAQKHHFSIYLFWIFFQHINQIFISHQYKKNPGSRKIQGIKSLIILENQNLLRCAVLRIQTL